MDRHKAIRNIYKNARRIDDGEGAFDENENKITLDESKISLEMERLRADFDSKKYQRDRAIQYPNITDVVVALAEKEEGDDTMWKKITAKRAKVKKDNPKPK